MSQSPPERFDVAIVGCGPVGALAALLLGRAGLPVLVLERETDLNPLPRAVHIDHEMMRLFQSAGVVDDVAPHMRATDGHLHVGADGGVIRYMGTYGRPKPFGWANDYFFYQPELEGYLRAAMGRIPAVHLELGAVFEAARQEQGRVRLGYRQGGMAREADVRWVIGCDGARSEVRKVLGVALDDLAFEEPWLVVDAEVEGPVSFPAITGVPSEADLQSLSVMMCDPRRPATIVPGRGNHRRWEFMLLPGEDDAEMMDPARVSELVGAWMKDVPHRIVRAATYRFHGLVAEQWKVGNIFLAGDAAHQTPPFFGQGMCHGLRDVANLAWKMAAVAKDGAGPALLDTYQIERDSHVRAVIGAAVEAGRYICMLDPEEAERRDAQLRERAASGVSETAADLIPAIGAGVILAGSPGAGQRFIQPQVGEKKLDDLTGGGWRLFVRKDPGGGGHSGVTVCDVSQIADGGALLNWLDLHGVDAVLVRPDHYVFGSCEGVATPLIEAMEQAMQMHKIAA
ncbi:MULTISPECIES: bifunctional 3-(3-hydroxy-phenyl)propionate/3-hydroxycinnamic acid hydroxylase [unclassified Sphingopyxis]|uniref:bifunctional 3-(3-hydroxy-phenyl)propionate/3-hydroxycinnamic acid hydroxylase n=1 Tax=unclassified Sphingopyxis TaxID=2614943 RepID=UPI00285AA541|nr:MULTISPECIES: bifunctional 3-(3-hydroxy-phenyl)propionate/3-hydroxycinnamic acid hydroxylase [unclassified Sphingopyxis]MDR6832596.1 3-(3-hydroxy-phenyl)propionate hydroxylase [Sphingopyxis sp. BE122]MDR7228339.1 3-(3-hydroxy-phenyl)propionate hydroxylase [Sphingopyxis sp. BE259]